MLQINLSLNSSPYGLIRNLSGRKEADEGNTGGSDLGLKVV